MGPSEDDVRGGGDITATCRGMAGTGGCVDAGDVVVPIAPTWLRLKSKGDGDRQLPNTASWNADAVGDGLE